LRTKELLLFCIPRFSSDLRDDNSNKQNLINCKICYNGSDNIIVMIFMDIVKIYFELHQNPTLVSYHNYMMI